MSSEAVSRSRTYPPVFVVSAARGGCAGWASLAAANTADKALLQHRDYEPKGSVLARFIVTIFQPIQAVIRWVKELVFGPEPKPRVSTGDCVLPGLQEGNLLTPEAYATLLDKQGGLTLALNSLALISLYGRTSSAEDVRDLLEARTEGVTARDWAQGSGTAVRIVAQSDENMQLFLADDLNQFARKACGVIQHTNAQSWIAAQEPTETQAGAMNTWLGPDNSQTRLRNLLEGLLSVRDERTRPIPAPTPLEAGELLGRRYRDFDMAAWARGSQSINTWFENASLSSRFEVAADLNGWADQASKLLFETQVEKVHFYGYGA